jgi:hypothetical protein
MLAAEAGGPSGAIRSKAADRLLNLVLRRDLVRYIEGGNVDR